MTDLPLRTQARLHEVDRQLQSMGIRLAFIHWVALPAVIASVASLVYFAAVHDVGFSTQMLGGIVGVGASIFVAVRGYRSLREEREGLQDERASVAAALTAPDDEAPPSLSDPPGA
ncbi:MAG: hypothetical protein AMXMBFR53_00060 [Gemmatimonadota bacterium]